MDIWSVGCVFYEVLTLVPLFPGANELDQVHRIHKILGSPTTDVVNKIRKNSQAMSFIFPACNGTGLQAHITNMTRECCRFIEECLTYDPERRLSSKQMVNHKYFENCKGPIPSSQHKVKDSQDKPQIFIHHLNQYLLAKQMRKSGG